MAANLYTRAFKLKPVRRHSQANGVAKIASSQSALTQVKQEIHFRNRGFSNTHMIVEQ
jgi:hypothetical protein